MTKFKSLIAKVSKIIKGLCMCITVFSQDRVCVCFALCFFFFFWLVLGGVIRVVCELTTFHSMEMMLQ